MLAINIAGLRKSFGAAAAVDGIDLDIEPGTFVTLLGPSGCGKTTTLRMLAGLERPDSGEIRVGDRILSSVQQRIFVPPERRKAGMVFQSYAIWPHMTVFQNVAFPLATNKVPKEQIKKRVGEVLDLVGLGHLADRPSPQLSGGQQQRVALARALVGSPDYLLLDEPLSNLDARLREQVRGEIRSMQQDLGITSVFVTHDQLEALTLSDLVVVMNAGRIEQIGTPAEVYEHSATKYVMDFLGHVNYVKVAVSPGSAGSANIRCGDMSFDVHNSIDITGAGEYLLAFRPNSVHHCPPDDADMTGQVERITYRGGESEYEVRVAGDLVKVVDTNPWTEVRGDGVGLRIDRRTMRFFADETPGAESAASNPSAPAADVRV